MKGWNKYRVMEECNVQNGEYEVCTYGMSENIIDSGKENLK